MQVSGKIASHEEIQHASSPAQLFLRGIKELLLHCSLGLYVKMMVSNMTSQEVNHFCSELTMIYKPSHTQAVKLLIKEFYTLIT